ncbi:replication/maintenance protein RepL [Arcobacter sp. CECT 9188]|uniref:replication/maintenance protein RepL n=1 Tax=Arcobacter sp. CECT 9188 TaxID=2044505 RepID=UPI000DE86E05|nr:replication/maintenance protein RepL [Arcobacter sp. CECT 9188]RBQ26933.1 hypothetical protein CRU88_04140 [Arcobacter sp. CECT 9188]
MEKQLLKLDNGTFINIKEQKKTIDDGLKKWRKIVKEDLNNLLLKLKSLEQIKLWVWFTNNMNSKNEVNTDRWELVEELGLGKSTVDNFLVFCREERVILKNKGLYIVNPNLIGVFGGGLKSLEQIKLWENLVYKEDVKDLDKKYKKLYKCFENEKETIQKLQSRYNRELNKIGYKELIKHKKLEEEYKQQELNKVIETNNDDDDNLPF